MDPIADRYASDSASVASRSCRRLGVVVVDDGDGGLVGGSRSSRRSRRGRRSRRSRRSDLGKVHAHEGGKEVCVLVIDHISYRRRGRSIQYAGWVRVLR